MLTRLALAAIALLVAAPAAAQVRARVELSAEPALPDATALAAKRAALRLAVGATIEAGKVRERLVDAETGTVLQRWCGWDGAIAGLPGVSVCLVREFVGGFRALQGFYREDTGAPVGLWRRWAPDGFVTQEERYDADGLLHGDCWYAARTSPDGSPVYERTCTCARGVCQCTEVGR